MAGLTDLFATQQIHAERSAFLECVIANTASDETDEVQVRLTNFDDRLRWPVQGWMPRGDTLPSRGDVGLCAQSDEGVLWLLVWMPGG